MFNSQIKYFTCWTIFTSLFSYQIENCFAGSLTQQPNISDNRVEYTNLGFRNLGNTCFANAVFKLLSANPEFLNFLKTADTSHTADTGPSINPKGKEKNKRVRKVSENRARKKIMKSLNKLLSRYKDLERPEIDHPQLKNKTNFYVEELHFFYNKLNSFFNNKYGEGVHPYFILKENGFIPGDQQDAVEFFSELLNIVNFVKAFHLSSRLESSDGTRYYNAVSQIFNLVPLYISDSKVNSLSEAFDQFVEEETLSRENWVNPDQGGEKLTQRKKKITVLDFDQIPSYFFASVNRFNHNLEKEKKYIDSKTPIRMRVYQQGSEWEDNAKSITIDYEPIGFVVHSGHSLYRGHYYSYIYDDHSQSWFEHNDSTVTKIDHPTNVEKTWNDISENGYIVLYREKQRAPAY